MARKVHKAKVVGKIDLSKVIKVKNVHDFNADDDLIDAAVKLRKRGITIDMVAKRIKMPKKHSLGIKLLGQLDMFRKNNFVIL